MKQLIQYLKAFYCIDGFAKMSIHITIMSAVLSGVLTTLGLITSKGYYSFAGNFFFTFVGVGFMIFLSKVFVSQMSRFGWFRDMFFGKNFDFQAAIDGHTAALSGEVVRDMAEEYGKNGEFHIYMGTSNDYLYKIGAGQRQGNQHVALNLPDSCQNIMVTGGIGSGKTVCAITPFLAQLLDPGNTNNGQAAAGLIFDIKGDFKGTVYDLANRYSRSGDIMTVGADKTQMKINIISGLSPQIAAAFLKSGFEQTGGQASDSFWVDSSTDAMKAGLTILKAVDMYTLNHLYKMVFDKNLETTVIEAAKQLTEGNLELIAALEYYEGVYLANDDRTLKSIKATIGTLLSTFAEPAVIDTFCNNEAADADTLFNDILEKGKIILLDFPLATYGYGAKTIYVLMKLRFMNLVQTRPLTPTINQYRPVFLCADEYQNAITKSGFVSDSTFWDKSRSAKCIGLISFQTVAAVVSALKGDKATTETILANFRQKFFFANEEPMSIEYIQKISGKFDKVRTTTTSSKSKHNTDIFRATNNEGSSTTTVQTQIFGAEDIRSLGQGMAIGIMRVNNQSFLDVLTMQYMPTNANTPAPEVKTIA